MSDPRNACGAARPRLAPRPAPTHPADPAVKIWRACWAAYTALLEARLRRERLESSCRGLRGHPDPSTQSLEALLTAEFELAEQADRTVSSLLASASPSPVSVAARLHVAVLLSRELDPLTGDWPARCCSSILRDLLPLLPSDMAQAIGPRLWARAEEG